MNGRVHAAVGALSALTAGAVIPCLRPEDTASLAEAVAFSFAGSLLPDIDINGSGKVKKTATTAVSLTVLIGLWLYRSGRTDIIRYFDVKTIIGGILFIACLAVGLMTKHRTFTHSLLGLILFSVAVFLLFTPQDTAFFAAAMFLHELLDMLNMTKVSWLWPAKGGVAAGLCKSDGLIAEAIGLAATLFCGVLLYLYYTKGLIKI